MYLFPKVCPVASRSSPHMCLADVLHYQDIEADCIDVLVIFSLGILACSDTLKNGTLYLRDITINSVGRVGNYLDQKETIILHQQLYFEANR